AVPSQRRLSSGNRYREFFCGLPLGRPDKCASHWNAANPPPLDHSSTLRPGHLEDNPQPYSQRSALLVRSHVAEPQWGSKQESHPRIRFRQRNTHLRCPRSGEPFGLSHNFDELGASYRIQLLARLDERYRISSRLGTLLNKPGGRDLSI